MRSIRLLSLTVGALTAATLTFGCAPADSGDEAGMQEVADAVTAAPDHYSVAYENDAVRLLRVSYEAGEESAMHSHPAHCAIALNDGTYRMTPAEGEPVELDLAMGEVACVEAGAHQIANAGSEAVQAVLVEFKPGATAGSDALPDYPGAVSADPEHYTVEHENDIARLLRIQYDAGETSTMHRHPANCAIFLSDQPTRMEMPDGETMQTEGYETGHVECWDAEAHLPTNMGEEGLELILVELKGRANWDGDGAGS
ncbi:MAG TPA: hypothetical protein VLA33_04485 [Gemmatimonadota bacterium]|nr:hypothetical protein [Gemmatimonadota bacterium]